MTGWPDPDGVAQFLTETAGELAACTPRQPSTSAQPEEIDFVGVCTMPALRALSRFNVAMTTTGVVEPAHWKTLAEVLETAVEQVYKHAPPEVFTERPPSVVDGFVEVTERKALGD